MMDYEQIQEVIAGHRAGREIEYRRNNSVVEGLWLNWQYSKGRFDFNFYSYDYRIKPEPPKPREWWIHVPVVVASTPDIFPCPQSYVSPNTREVHVREVLPDEKGMK